MGAHGEHGKVLVLVERHVWTEPAQPVDDLRRGPAEQDRDTPVGLRLVGHGGEDAEMGRVRVPEPGEVDDDRRRALRGRLAHCEVHVADAGQRQVTP